MEKKFKPFDKVLVKSHYDHCWKPDFFCYKIEGKGIQTIGGFYNEENILPYEGNENLVGSDLPADEEVRLEEGECLLAVQGVSEIEKNFKNLEYYTVITYNGIKEVESDIYRFYDNKNSYWRYAVKFSDFNPNDMEETKKHILCVKNGKIVKYRENNKLK